MNFGSDVAIPGFEFMTQDAIDGVSESVTVLNLRQAGLPIPTAWAYDHFGIPAPDDDEDIMGPTLTRSELFKQDNPEKPDEAKNDGENQEKTPESPPEQSGDAKEVDVADEGE
jgi:phage gp29-like protein